MKGQGVYFSALTSMRGVAALGVVLFHVLALLPQLAQQVPASLGLRGYLWVDFFFVLSGFVLAHSNGWRFAEKFRAAAYRDFMVARFARIYPAYFVVLFLFVVLEFVARDAAVAAFGDEVREIFFAGPYSPQALLSNSLMLQSLGLHGQLTWNMPGWSLSAEWLSYLLVPLIFTVFAGAERRTFAVLVVTTIAGLVGVQVFLGQGDIDVTHDFGVLRCLLEVSLGFGIYRLRPESGWGVRLGGDGPVLLLLLAIPLSLYLHLSDVVIVCLFALVILGLSLNQGRVQAVLSARPLLYLGVISYSVYLVQWLLFRSAKMYLAIAMDTNPADYFTSITGWWFALAMLFGSVLAGALLHHGVEHPMQVRVKRAFQRRQ